MVFRRGTYFALRWAPVVLPTWFVVVSWIWHWQDIGGVIAPLFFGLLIAAALAVVFFLTWIRKDVRLDQAVSWVDVGVLGTWLLLIVASPFPIPVPMLLFVLIVGVIAFWSAVVQWVLETRRRVKSVVEEFSDAAASAREFQATRVTVPGRPTPDAPLRGHVIRLDPPVQREGD